VIGSYDPTTKKVDFVFGTGQRRTHMLFVTEANTPIFTTNMGSNTMSMIEKSALRPGREDWDQTLIPVGKGPEGFDVRPDGKEVWVANSQDGTVSIIDVTSKKVTNTLDANVKGANRLKFTPDGKRVFISTLAGSDATVIDVATHSEVKRIKLGRGAAGIQMQPDGVRAFIACTPDDYVAIIDMKSLEIVGRIDAGKQPDGMAWAIRR
jgi:YVTN family beta-propeller protein